MMLATNDLRLTQIPSQDFAPSPIDVPLIDDQKQKKIREPSDQNEFDIRIQYAWNLLGDAHRLRSLENVSDEKINAAYKKANEAKEGFYYYDDKSAMAKKLLKKDKIAYLNQESGVLTLSEKNAKLYQIGQKISGKNASEIISTDNKTGITFFDLSQVHAFTKDKLGFLKKTGTFSLSKKRVQDYGISREFSSEGKHEIISITITKIIALTNKEMSVFKQQVMDFCKPRYMSIFDITYEKQLAIQNQMINQQDDGSPLTLKKWQNESRIDPTIEEKTNINPNDVKNCIYIFGTYNKAPVNGLYDSTHPGVYLNLTKPRLLNIGRTKELNFLSNAYDEKKLIIPGEKKSCYRSVTHYLFHKRIEKSRENAETKRKFNSLEEILDSDSSALEINNFAERHYNDFFSTLPCLFYDLDNELKKALFYKFAYPDGSPNEEGRKLLATGNDQLYAGYEIGDKSYGMVFVDRDSKSNELSMEGANKLGKCLMELREILRSPQS